MKRIQTGIWLDFRDAYLITLEDNGVVGTHHIHSNVEHPATKGGSRSKTPWGPQFSPPDDTNQERANHAEHLYFQDIIEKIDPKTDQLVIFGPAEAKIGLKKEIEKIKHYKPEIIGVLPADYLSENERRVLVQQFFLSPSDYLDK